MTRLEEPSFGALLQAYRRTAGLSQEVLAERSGVSLAAIGALERGVRRWPYPHTVTQLAAALDLPLEERALLEQAAHRRTAAGRDPASARRATAGPVALAKASIAPPLTGRKREWAWLESELKAWRSLLLLRGEPGIGKTRLLREAIGWARRHGWRVLWGGCQRSSGQEPYAPIAEALERYIRSLPHTDLRASLKDYAWLGRLLPELADEAGIVAPPQTVSPEQEQRLLFAAVERYLSHIAGPAGTLLVLDDLQWAGADALQLAARLLRRTNTRRIRILGAYRSTDVPPGHPLATLSADLARDDLVGQLELAPLEHGDAAVLVSALLQESLREASENEWRWLVERIVERTGGVPFFLVSCARWWQTLAQQSVQHDPGEATERSAQAQLAGWAPGRPEEIEELPWNVTQSIRERVAALPASAQRLLDVGAVVGKPVSGVLLAEAAGRSEEDALVGLEAACRAGLLVEEHEASRPVRYRYGHDLIREVVDASLSAWRRTVLHRRVAEAFERELEHGEGPERWADRPLTQLAYHYARANMPEKALVYLRQAGDQARDMYAHQDAAAYYKELTVFLDRLERSREAAQARSDLAVELARVGRLSEALEPLEQAERIYRAAGDVDALALVTTAIGHTHSSLGTFDEGLARLQPLIEALPGEAGGGGRVATALEVSTAVSAQLQGALADLSFMAGRYHDGLDAAQRAVDAAQATADEGLLARQRLSLSVALHSVGRTAEAIENLERAIAGAEAAGDLETLSDALRMASWVYQTRGAFAESKRVQAQAMEAAQRLGDTVGFGYTVFFDALLAYYVGDWRRAREIGERASAVFQSLELVLLSSYPPLGLGWLNLVEGHSDEAERYLAEAKAIAERSREDQVLRLIEALLAERDLLIGQPAAARARLAPLFGHGLLQERTRVELMVLRAWAAVQLGAEVEAEEFVDDSVRSAREHEIYLALPDALRVQALWAMRQRRWQEAERALEEALVLSRAMPYPYAEAKAWYASGQLQAAKGEPERARAAFAEALALCHRLGERLYAEHIEHELADLGR